MPRKFFIVLLESILILIINFGAISCLPNSFDFEIDVTKNAFNGKNVIIDLSKIFGIKKIDYMEIIYYDEGFELHSSKNPNKKLNPGDMITLEEKIIIELKSKNFAKINPGKIIYSLISKYKMIPPKNNTINVIIRNNITPTDEFKRKLQYVENSNTPSEEIPTIIPTIIPKLISSSIPNEIIKTTINSKTDPIFPQQTIPPKITKATYITQTLPNNNYRGNNTETTSTSNTKETTIEILSYNEESTKIEQIKTSHIVDKGDSKVNNESYCSMEDLLNDTCHQGKMNLNDINDIKDYFIEQRKQGIQGDDDSFYKKIKTGNVIIQYGTLDEQKNAKDHEASSIDLGDCEQQLKTINGINKTKSLIVYKVDVKTSDLSSTYVQYEVYNPDNMQLLNLSICEKIIINTPVDIGSQMEEIYNSLSESGYNLFDSEDSFYQDICTTYTTLNGTDMILSDRKKDIYSSTSDVTMCQTGCTLESYNSNTKKASCNCDASTAQTSLSNLDIDSLFDKNEIKSSFYDTLTNSNFRVLKCVKLVFSSKFFKNLGGFFMTLISLVFFAFHLLSFSLYQSMVDSYISKIIDLNGENIRPNTEQNEKNADMNNNNSNETNKENKEEKNTKSKKGKKNKKSKKKKSSEEAQFPPKKSKKKNKSNDNNNNIGLESSKNDMTSVKVDPNNKNDNQPGISVYQPNKQNNNNLKIKDEKNIINSKGPLENTDDEKGENKEENLDINKLNDQEINDLSYENALKIDKRTYLQYYWSLLKKKHLILFTFWPANDYNIYMIKISLFCLSFGLYFTINGFFFTDDTMHKLYEDKGKYNIVYRIPQIFFSTIISAIINVLLKTLSLTEKSILSVKQEKDIKNKLEKSKSIQRNLKFKFLIYFILSIVFMLFFWYFISCFCAVYTNTQFVLIKDTLVSYALSMVYPFALNLLPGFFRIPALKAEKGDKAYQYKLSQYIALI